ncbi:MAG: hypothetical protein P8Y18_11840 [Candidatus Bathyarchaeota archaeon]
MNKLDILLSLSSIIIAVLVFSIWIFMDKEVLNPDLAETIFSTLTQVNATLVGFFGIVMVYNLRAFSSTKTLLMTNAFLTTEKIQLLGVELENETDKNKKANLKIKKAALDKNLADYKTFIKEVTSEKSKFGNFSIAPMLCFVASIMLCVFSLGIIDETGVNSMLLIPSLLSMFLGVFFTILSMGTTVPSESEKIFLT